MSKPFLPKEKKVTPKSDKKNLYNMSNDERVKYLQAVVQTSDVEYKESNFK